MKKLRWLIVLGAVVNLTGTGLFVWTSAQARQENCENTEQAFSDFTDALAEEFHASEETEERFRARYEDDLAECH